MAGRDGRTLAVLELPRSRGTLHPERLCDALVVGPIKGTDGKLGAFFGGQLKSAEILSFRGSGSCQHQPFPIGARKAVFHPVNARRQNRSGRRRRRRARFVFASPRMEITLVL